MANRSKRRQDQRAKQVRAGVTPQRCLIASNAPFVGTGYGVQTAQLSERLVGDGHEVAIACNFGLQGSETEWNGIKLYPTGVQPYSDDILMAHSQHWASGSQLPSLVLTLFDVWALKNPSIDRIPRIASWVPIDHKPAPPEEDEFIMLNITNQRIPNLKMKKGCNLLEVKTRVCELMISIGQRGGWCPERLYAFRGGGGWLPLDGSTTTPYDEASVSNVNLNDDCVEGLELRDADGNLKSFSVQ